jgi:protein O-mannose beta-1,4-N-acetylglucosaminyltransferase
MSPQGPIPDKNVNGVYVRHAVEFIKWRLGLSVYNQEYLPFAEAEPDTAVVFSRRENRLIVNEDELLTAVSTEFKLKPQFVRMEDMKFHEQVKVLGRTKVAIGMHGSVLIMGLFLPRGSVLIELYPYAVPSDNYTPYRTMSRLPGMNIAYRAWENKYPDNNIPHPDRDMYHGGINHLKPEERDAILNTPTVPKHTCCTNPYWLFRIYQDTKVHVDEVKALVADALKESTEKSLATVKMDPTIMPSPVLEKTITCSVVFHDKTIDSVLIKWDEPWNGVRPDKYSIWEHIAYREFFSETNSISIKSPKYTEGTQLEIWVRPVKNGVSGRYSDKHLCILAIP